MFDYENMKLFLVTFSYWMIMIAIVASYIYHITNLVRWIIKKVRRHKDKQRAIDKIIEQA